MFRFVYVAHFVCSSIHRPLGCFCFWAAVSSAAANMLCSCPPEPFLLGGPWSGAAGSHRSSRLSYLRGPTLFSGVAASFYIPPAVHEGPTVVFSVLRFMGSQRVGHD